MGRLDGKVAIVTGASRGIGAAVVRRYCMEGAKVAINYPPEGEMARLAEALVDELAVDGYQAIAVPADVSDPAQVEAMVEVTREAYGDADVLVTNAAAFRRGPWTECTPEQWDHIFSVNAKGTFLCSRAVYPGMLRRGGGSIITVSSVTVRAGFANMIDYVATKGAIVGFTRSLAREVGPERIRVNSVMPGAIRTEHEIELGTGEQRGEQRAAQRQCLPRRGFPEDLTGTFTYLASDDSDFVTGQVIAVDGGWVHR